MNSFNRFTIKAQEALQKAQDLATAQNHGEFRALHLLAALIADHDSLVRPILEKSGAELESLTMQIDEELRRLPKIFSTASIAPSCELIFLISSLVGNVTFVNCLIVWTLTFMKMCFQVERRC